MYRISVMYPSKEGARFDLDYYRTTHIKMAEDKLKPFVCVKDGVDRGEPQVGPGDGPQIHLSTGGAKWRS